MSRTRSTASPERDAGDATTEATFSVPSFTNQANLREQIREALRALLITGQMRPGHLYSAPRLAAEFGVSPTPVREAMLDLVSEGLVEVARNKGFRVTHLEDRDLDEIAELRGLVEVPVMRAVARACTGPLAEEVERLREVARRIVAAAADGDLVTYTEADTEFHLRFLALHGNRHAVSVVRDLRRRSRLYGLEALVVAGVLAQLAEEHEQMVDAALDQDANAMQTLMSRHIGHIRSTWAQPSVRPSDH